MTTPLLERSAPLAALEERLERGGLVFVGGEAGRSPPGAELAMAYSNMAQLLMLARDIPGAEHWGLRAIELAEALGETETLAHALNNVGTAKLHRGARGAGAAGRWAAQRGHRGALFLSQRTVDHYVSAILRKLGVRSRVEARAEAVRLGISD